MLSKKGIEGDNIAEYPSNVNEIILDIPTVFEDGPYQASIIQRHMHSWWMHGEYFDPLLWSYTTTIAEGWDWAFEIGYRELNDVNSLGQFKGCLTGQADQNLFPFTFLGKNNTIVVILNKKCVKNAAAGNIDLWDNGGISPLLTIHNVETTLTDAYNMCLGVSNIKVYDTTGGFYHFPDVKGGCADDIVYPGSGLFGTADATCEGYLGGYSCGYTLESGKVVEGCVFNERDCEIMPQPDLCGDINHVACPTGEIWGYYQNSCQCYNPFQSNGPGNIEYCNCERIDCRSCCENRKTHNLDLKSALCCNRCCKSLNDSTSTSFYCDGIDDSSIIYGCTNPMACNYNSQATHSDHSCQYEDCAGVIKSKPSEVCGCTDPIAGNYNRKATKPCGYLDNTCSGHNNINECCWYYHKEKIKSIKKA